MSKVVVIGGGAAGRYDGSDTGSKAGKYRDFAGTE